MSFNTVGIQDNLPVLPVHVLQIIESLTFSGTYSAEDFFREGRTNFGAAAFTSSAHVEMHSMGGADPLVVYSGIYNDTEVFSIDVNGTTTATSLTASDATITTLAVADESVVNSSITNATINNATIQTGNITAASIGSAGIVTLNAVTTVTNQFTASNARATNAVITNGTVTNLTATNASLTGSLQGSATSAATASYIQPLVQTVSITGPTSVTGTLGTTGAATIGGGASVGGALAVAGTTTININNTDYINTGGANSHILLNNPNAVGQSVISSVINNKLVGKIRSDYEGNMTYVASGSGLYGNHYFWVGGDFPQGTVAMIVSSSGQVGIGTQSPLAKLHVIGNILANNLTGSLQGTASYASEAFTATTASYALYALAGPGVSAQPSGSNTQIQYNNNGAFGGVPVLTYNGASLVATGSFQGNLQGTASFTNLIAGPGISVNGMAISASVRTVNGISPTNGNISVSLAGVLTGQSSSLAVSSSGTITGSITNAALWVVSNDGTPANNGDVYIFQSGSVGQWLPVAPLDTAAGDARYLLLSGLNAMAGDLDVDGYDIINGGTFFGTAETASFVTASGVFGPYGASSVVSASQAVTASHALTASYVANTINTAAFITTGSNSAVQSITGSLTVSRSFAAERIVVGNQIQDIGPGSVSIWGTNTGTHSLSITNGGAVGGDYALAQGYNNYATGDYSHAQGKGTGVVGDGGHAEGENATVIGNCSHAEGFNTAVFGTHAHAEGWYTQVNGNYAHAEGRAAEANGAFSHAEGNTAIATGYVSHAEGQYTLALGTGSHAEGWYTRAQATGSHTEGFFVTASGNYSHAEGTFTVASGQVSHAEGSQTFAAGVASHAEGNTTTAVGDYSHAEGQNTVANGVSSHAEGFSTTTNNSYAHAEGGLTYANGQYSHAEGFQTIAVGDSSHTEGLGTIASGSYQTVIGKYNKKGNTTSLFVIGNGTGTTDANRSDIVRVDSSTVGITGSLNVLGSFTVNGASVAPDASAPQTVRITLSNAQILNLQSSPVTLVAAPGAGKVVLPMKLTIANGNGTAYNDFYVSIRTPSGNSFLNTLYARSSANGADTQLLKPFSNPNLYITYPIVGSTYYYVDNQDIIFGTDGTVPTFGTFASVLYFTYQVITL